MGNLVTQAVLKQIDKFTGRMGVPFMIELLQIRTTSQGYTGTNGSRLTFKGFKVMLDGDNPLMTTKFDSPESYQGVL